MENAKAAGPGFLSRVKEKMAKNKTDRSGERLDDRKKLRAIMDEGAVRGKCLAHNGLVACAWGALMLAVAYADLQGAMVAVAVALSQTGGIMMESQADVITVYVVLIVVGGLCLAAGIAAEKAVLRAMARRFWRAAPGGGIDKGEFHGSRRPEGD